MKKLTTHQTVAIFIAVPVVFFVFLSFNFFGIFGGASGLVPDVAPESDASLSRDAAGTLDGLPPDQVVINDKIVGNGAEARAGALLTVNYVGALTDGTVFDSSLERGPFQFVLGAGQVIPGWDQGLLGMREGGRRALLIPPALAYGEEGIGPIPGNATLIFEVELLSVEQSQ